MAQLPTFPSIDFSGLDASKLAGLDGKVVAVARDAAYITIGFGVLGFQQAQVRRRELLKSLDGRVGASKTQMDDLRSTIETRITKLDERFTALETPRSTPPSTSSSSGCPSRPQPSSARPTTSPSPLASRCVASSAARPDLLEPRLSSASADEALRPRRTMRSSR